jgi:flagellar motor switch protein FliN/FliY
MAAAGAQTAIGQEEKAAAGTALSIAAPSGARALSMEAHPAWPMISRLPAVLAVSIPLNRFKVCDLLNLECGTTIESTWPETEDVPLKAGALQLCWGEFEVVEQNMALRLTRLA